jgi:hypothetical protein
MHYSPLARPIPIWLAPTPQYPKGVRVLPPSPNPFGEQTFIEIELENAETAVLELVDLTGRLLLSEQKNLHSGTNRWEIAASTMAPGNFAIWRLRVGGQMVSGKLVRE